MVVELWMRDTRVGCGLRRFIVLKQGRKWVTLFHAPSLTRLQVSMQEFGRARPAQHGRALRSLLRANMKAARARGEFDGGVAARDALVVLGTIGVARA